MSTKIRLRFAPSPTGLLHIGNLRIALLNYLFARSSGGDFLLRLDDTDAMRCKPEYERAIKQDLQWLNMEPQACFRQSERLEQYQQATLRLRRDGLLYPCYETKAELERARRIAVAAGRPPIYNRAALQLSSGDRNKLEEQGRQPHWRFRLSGQRLSWNDLVRGEQYVDTASISDPVLIRADGSYLYTLPSVVDDGDNAISHIVRGEDHVTNSGAQIEIFRALGAKPPQMAHIPLMIDHEGEPLSKRSSALSIAQLRDDGIEVMALLSLLARLGTSEAVRVETDIDSLSDNFSFNAISRAPIRFAMTELLSINAGLIRDMAYASVRERLLAMEFGANAGPEFWSAIAPNISRIDEASIWLRRLFGPAERIDMSEADRKYVGEAAQSLPARIATDSWSVWTRRLAAAGGRSGRKLFMPLRLALTGCVKGPEMQLVLPLLGRAGIIERLQLNANSDDSK